MLAAAVAVAAAVALLGNHSTTPAEVQGAPLDPGGSGRTGRVILPAGALANADRTDPPSGAAPGSAAASAPAGTRLGDLFDLDQRTLSADGTHFEVALKDGRRAALTLDPPLQALAEKLLVEARAPRGAIVVMAPDGRILAIAGRRNEPAAKPAKKPPDAVFDWRLATEVWAPAASVFKLVTASALVSAGVDPDGKVCFHGGLRSVMESNLHDDRRDSRCESLTYGVAHSNNAILGKLAFQKLAAGDLDRFAHELGVAGALPGADLAGASGTIDIPAEKNLVFAQSAAGFSGSQLSVMGGALLAAAFADAGEQPVPRLIAAIDGVAVPAAARHRAIPPEVARAVGQMMQATCEFGSASRSFGRHQAVHVAGKTGTLARSEPFYMEHSWFVGYAPAEQPEVIVSVLLGNPENWHLRGHEAARRLIDRALDRHDKDPGAKITSTRSGRW